jgi:hypothetical protein
MCGRKGGPPVKREGVKREGVPMDSFTFHGQKRSGSSLDRIPQTYYGFQPIFSKNQTANTGASTTLRTSEPSARIT